MSGKDLRDAQLRATRQVNYALAHRAELMRDYRGQWIAVSVDGVVANADTRDALFRCLANEGIAFSDVYVDFIPENPTVYVR
jgi:hypothetical protein